MIEKAPGGEGRRGKPGGSREEKPAEMSGSRPRGTLGKPPGLTGGAVLKDLAAGQAVLPALEGTEGDGRGGCRGSA